MKIEIHRNPITCRRNKNLIVSMSNGAKVNEGGKELRVGDWIHDTIVDSLMLRSIEVKLVVNFDI